MALYQVNTFTFTHKNPKSNPRWSTPNHNQNYQCIIPTGCVCRGLENLYNTSLLKKIGADLLAKNYCPDSNLKFVSKVMEQCVVKQFIIHCDHNDLILDYQSAYCSNYSCETAVVKLMDDILNNVESKEGTALMAINLSAAFNTVKHNILLDVLHSKFRIRGTALNWFESYLRNRYCKVCIVESYSTHRKLDFSVAQGPFV